MQQKVQFLASIIHEPELIILDEPFSGLDPVNAMLLNQIVRELHDEGRTILFSTHVLHQAEQMCDRIVLIDRGRKILDDSLEHIRRRFDPHTVTVTPLEEPASYVRRIEDVPGVISSHIDDDGRVHARIADDMDPAVCMQALVAVEPVRAIELGRTSLDEVFVRLVGGPRGTETSEPKEAVHG